MITIAVNHIVKKYGNNTALDDINLEVNKGELFGLIGPDGAGKTTLFRILTTLLLPDDGSATLMGLDAVRDMAAIRKRLGYMPGKFSLYPDLSVEENLNFFASLFGVSIKDNYDLIAPIYKQIEPFASRRAGKLSGGMKQKLALCCALIHKPDILFLDEPTTGVDAVSRKEFWDMLNDLKAKGITIFASTPYMDEAYRCDRIALINEGRVMTVDSPAAIVKSFGMPLYALRGKEPNRLLPAIRAMEGVVSSHPFGESMHVATKPSFDAQKALAALRQQGLEAEAIESTEASIEDVFIKLMTSHE